MDWFVLHVNYVNRYSMGQYHLSFSTWRSAPRWIFCPLVFWPPTCTCFCNVSKRGKTRFSSLPFITMDGRMYNWLTYERCSAINNVMLSTITSRTTHVQIYVIFYCCVERGSASSLPNRFRIKWNLIQILHLEANITNFRKFSGGRKRHPGKFIVMLALVFLWIRHKCATVHKQCGVYIGICIEIQLNEMNGADFLAKEPIFYLSLCLFVFLAYFFPFFSNHFPLDSLSTRRWTNVSKRTQNIKWK